jgi:hypothetical protein
MDALTIQEVLKHGCILIELAKLAKLVSANKSDTYKFDGLDSGYRA